MTTHAKHISDWDKVRAGQYFYVTGSVTNYTLAVSTYFKDLDGDASKAQMSSFLADAAKLGAAVQGEASVTTFANDIVGASDDLSGDDMIFSSRLVPGSVYSDAPERIGSAYKLLLPQGIQLVIGLLVAGGASDFRDILWSYPKLHHLRRPSGCQCPHQFRCKPCMALGKGPCEHSPRYSSLNHI
jgi:hypothetical protein